MATRTIQRWTVILATAVGLALAVGGCAEKITGIGPTTKVTVNLALKAGPAVSFRLTVTAADMDTVRVLMAPTDTDLATAPVSIPLGVDRHFLAEALDQTGVVLYSGEAIADLISIQPLDLVIDLVPVAPMIYLNPHYSTVRVGDSFTITVCANNLPDLSGVGLGLSFDNQSKGDKLFDPAVIDSVVMDPSQTEQGAFLSYSIDTPSSVFFSLANEGPIVDADGDACLVTIYGHAQDTWFEGRLDVIPAMFIENLNGITLNPADVHLDTARFRLFRERTPQSYVDAGGTDIGVAMIDLGGGQTMLAGTSIVVNTSTEGLISNLYLARLDANLQPQSEQLLPWNFLRLTTGLAHDVDGGFYATGTDPQNGAAILFTDEAGQEIRRLDLGIDHSLYAVAARPGGGGIAAGSWSNDGNHYYLGAFSPSGALVNFEPTDFSNDQEFRSVIALDDTTFVAAGTNRPFSTGSEDLFIGQYVLRDRITPVWERTVNNEVDSVTRDLLATDDGGYLIVGGIQLIRGGLSDVYAVRTDETGKPLWTRSFGTAADDVGMAVTPAGDGGFVIAGYSGEIESPRDIILVKLSADGDIIWQRVHGGPDDEIAQDIMRTGSGFLVTGTSALQLAGGSVDILLLSVDSEGR